ncbi:MAG: STAS domain-containing protein [Chloroflexia bacterium]
MDLTVSQEQGRIPVTVFRLKGPVIESDRLEQGAKEAHDAGARNLVIDLSDVPYMASPGLRALHYIYTLFREPSSGESDEAVQKGIAAGTYKSPHLKLVNPNRDVFEILKATGYDMFLDIHKDLKGALASF